MNRNGGRFAPEGVQIQRTRYRLRKVILRIGRSRQGRPVTEETVSRSGIGGDKGGLGNSSVQIDVQRMGITLAVVHIRSAPGAALSVSAPGGLEFVQMIGDLGLPDRVQRWFFLIHTVVSAEGIQLRVAVVRIIDGLVAPPGQRKAGFRELRPGTQLELGIVCEPGDRGCTGIRVDASSGHRDRLILGIIGRSEIEALNICNRSAVGVVYDACRADPDIDRVQIDDFLTADALRVIRVEGEGLARRVDPVVVGVAHLPAYKGIPLRRCGGLCQGDFRIVRIAVRQKKILRGAVVECPFSGRIGKIIDSRLLPVQTQGHIVVGVNAEGIGRLRAVLVHLIPSDIGIDAGGVFKGSVLGSLARVLRVIGMTVRPAVVAALAVSGMVYIIPRPGAGFHIVAGCMPVLADRLALVGGPEPCRPCAGAVFFRVERAIVRVNGHDVPLRLPARIEGQIAVGHGLENHIRLVFAGPFVVIIEHFQAFEFLVGRGSEESPAGAGLICIPAAEPIDYVAVFRLAVFRLLDRKVAE